MNITTRFHLWRRKRRQLRRQRALNRQVDARLAAADQARKEPRL